MCGKKYMVRKIDIFNNNLCAGSRLCFSEINKNLVFLQNLSKIMWMYILFVEVVNLSIFFS